MMNESLFELSQLKIYLFCFQLRLQYCDSPLQSTDLFTGIKLPLLQLCRWVGRLVAEDILSFRITL